MGKVVDDANGTSSDAGSTIGSFAGVESDDSVYATGVIGLTDTDVYRLVPHSLGREPPPIFAVYSDCASCVTFDSSASVSVQNEITENWSSFPDQAIFHSELGPSRMTSAKLYDDLGLPEEVAKRPLRNPLVDPVSSEYASFYGTSFVDVFPSNHFYR